MQKLTAKPATPSSWQAGRGSGQQGKAGVDIAQGYSSTMGCAIAIRKRQKMCVVSKLTTFLGSDELILAIAHRNQVGTQAMISVPVCVLSYAEAQGVKMLYYRNDKQGTMHCISLLDLKKKAYLKQSDGVLEYFIRISDMRPCPWRAWHFVEKTVVLTDKQETDTKQLALL